MIFNADDGRPPYQQLAETLQKEVLGNAQPGDKLPTLRTIERRYDVASGTAQNAYRSLQRKGLIYSIRGKGTFMREAPEMSAPQLPHDLAAQVTRLSDQVDRLHRIVEQLTSRNEAVTIPPLRASVPASS